MHKLDFNHIASKIEKNQSLNLPEKEKEWLNAVLENAKTLEHTFDSVKGFHALNLNKPYTKHFKLKPLWYAAASVLMVFVAAIIFISVQNNTTKLIANKGQIIENSLPDQSQVTLYGGTELNYTKSFNLENRSVNLNGKAFFNITKNKSLPFVIKTQSQTIKVIGTSFTVQSYASTPFFGLQVYEGIVQVECSQGKYQLKAGDNFTITTNGKTKISKSSNTIFSPNLIEFENTEFGIVVKEVEAQFGIALSYDKAFEKELITLKTTSTSATEMAKILSATIGSQVKIVD